MTTKQTDMRSLTIVLTKQNIWSFLKTQHCRLNAHLSANTLEDALWIHVFNISHIRNTFHDEKQCLSQLSYHILSKHYQIERQIRVSRGKKSNGKMLLKSINRMSY